MFHFPRRGPIFDPAPPWEFLFNSLDKNAVIQLAAIQLSFAAKEIEAEKTVLDARLKAIGAVQDVIKKASVK